MVLTSSRLLRPAEPRDSLLMTAKVRGSSTLVHSRPHPSGHGDPSEELAYSLEVARSSGPAWHSQVWGVLIRWQNGWSIFTKTTLLFTSSFLLLIYSKFLVKSILLPLSSSVRLWLTVLVSVLKNRAVPLGVPQTHDVSIQPRGEHSSWVHCRELGRLTGAPTHSPHKTVSEVCTHTHTRRPEVNSLPFLPPSSPYD